MTVFECDGCGCTDFTYRQKIPPKVDRLKLSAYPQWLREQRSTIVSGYPNYKTFIAQCKHCGFAVEYERHFSA